MTQRFILLTVVLVCSLAVVPSIFAQRQTQGGRAAAPPAAPPDLKTLAADVERLKSMVPSNSHIMMDVQWHWTNLWFAAQAKNWPLATYQFNEARGHMQWLTRKSPIIRSQGPDREEVDIEGILGGIETSGLADVKAAIDAKDGAKFAKAYRAMLESCYSCHKAVGRPYIKPMIPKTPAQSIMNVDPAAEWPK